MKVYQHYLSVWARVLLVLTSTRFLLFPPIPMMEFSPRTPTGKFSSVCRNPLHSEWKENLLETYPGLSENDFKLVRPSVSELQNFEDVCGTKFKVKKGASVKFCELCVNHVNELGSASSSPRPRQDHDYHTSKPVKRRKTVETVVSDNNGFNKDDLFSDEFLQSLEVAEIKQLAYKIGNIASSTISLSRHEGLYKNNNFLQNLDLDSYTNTFSSVVGNFLDGLKSTKRENWQDSYNKAKIQEHVLHMLYPSSVLPLCFLENFVLYNKTSSRLAVDLIGAGGPHGCYDTVKEWLANQSMNQLSFPNGDCVVIFDNGRFWKVKLNNKVNSRIVTTICQIEYPGYGSIQNESRLLPKFWNLDLESLCENVREIPEYLSNIHYRLLYVSVLKHLQIVLEQQVNKDDGLRFRDIVDEEVLLQVSNEQSRICQKCGYVNGKSKRICGNQNCKTNLKQAELDVNRLDELGTFTAKEKCVEKPISEIRLKVKYDMGICEIQKERDEVDDESEIVNHLENGHRPKSPSLITIDPNSFDSVRSVLRQIGLNSGIKLYNKNGNREWVFIVCDGLPYGLCQHVINTTYRCKNCQASTDSFNSKDEFDKHHLSSHPDAVKDEFLEFSWVVLRPGNGHYAMNMFKTFVELNWGVFFCELCQLMGFRSENAQRAAKNCSDNHKTWTLLYVAYEGTLQELMVPYVRACLAKEIQVTPKGFLEYVLVEAKNPNYVYTSTMILTYLQAIMNMRTGLRVGNIDAITSAKIVFAPLFHSRNHSRYQEIEMTEAVQRHSIPKEMVDFFNETESVCLSDDKTSGEGLDFKAEIVNKDVQSWMPRGVPTGEDWLRVTRNLDNLKKLGEKARELVSSQNIPTSKSRNQSLDEQVFGWRTCLRRREFLLHPLDSSKKHVSISEEELDSELVNFTFRQSNVGNIILIESMVS